MAWGRDVVCFLGCSSDESGCRLRAVRMLTVIAYKIMFRAFSPLVFSTLPT
jgi:hypothetical protein